MSIKVYVFSLIGIAVLSVLIEIILPSGKMQKFIKSMFSLLIMCVFIMPIIKLFNNKINFNEIFESSHIEIDTDFLNATNKKIYTQMEENIKTLLKNKGYYNVGININYNVKNYETYIDCIKINIKNIKIDINKPHKEIKQDIIEAVLEYILIDIEKIIFLE